MNIPAVSSEEGSLRFLAEFHHALRDCSPLAFSKMLTQIALRVHTRYGNGYWVKLD